jgi:Trk-type K+ transport system membrane component
MGKYQPLIWALVGACALVVANVAFCWFATAPDHYEWTDPALFMAPFLAVIGGAIGGIAGTIRRRRLLRRRDGVPADRR